MNRDHIIGQLKQLAEIHDLSVDEDLLNRAVEMAHFKVFSKGSSLFSKCSPCFSTIVSSIDNMIRCLKRCSGITDKAILTIFFIHWDRLILLSFSVK